MLRNLALVARVATASAARTAAAPATCVRAARVAAVLPTTQTQTRWSHGIVTHKNTVENSADVPFEFTPAHQKQIDVLLAKYPENYKQSAIMPMYVAALFVATSPRLCFSLCAPPGISRSPHAATSLSAGCTWRRRSAITTARSAA
jgi:hypothetical protein